MSDEDEEVLLADGPFHRYMVENNIMNCPLFSKEDTEDNTYNIISPFSLASIEISAETKELLDILLTSSLMLDEDAQWLYLLSERTDINYERLNLKTLMCLAVLCISVFTTLFFNDNFELWVTLLVISSCLTAHVVRKLMSYRLLNRNISKLCENINIAYSELRKKFIFLNHQITCIASKELANHDISDTKVEFKWAKEAVSVVSSEMMIFLLDSVKLCKVLTLELMSGSADRPSGITVLAFSTDSELGLDKIITLFENGSLNLSILEKMRHLCILMQSQFLLILGYYVCKINSCAERNKIAAILGKYNEFLINSTPKMRNYHTLNAKTKMKTGCSAKIVKELCSAQMIDVFDNVKPILHSLLAIVDDIEDLLINEIEIKDKFDVIHKSLETMTKNVDEIDACVKKVKKILIRENQENVEIKLPPTGSTKENTENGKANLIEVGKSDFTVTSADEVFVGIPGEDDDDKPYDNSDKDDTMRLLEELDSKVHDTYQNVLSEMQDVLILKKEEYEKRELLAAKKLKDPKLEEIISSIHKNEPLVNDVKETADDKDEVENEKEDHINQIIDIDLHKSIALKAVSKFNEWKHSAEDLSFEC